MKESLYKDRFNKKITSTFIVVLFILFIVLVVGILGIMMFKPILTFIENFMIQ